MKKIVMLLLFLVFLLLITTPINAEDNWFLKTAYDSVMETDRHQSYNWYNGSKENPVISPNGYKVYEVNPFAISDTREQFDVKVDVAKKLGWYLPEYVFKSEKVVMLTRLGIVGVQILNVAENNVFSKEKGYSRNIILSKEFKF